MTRTYRVCTRCIMDTSDPEIRFDGQGVCNYCKAAIERMRKQLPTPDMRERALGLMVDKIKADGKGKDYDCIIGVSGGVDSTATAYWVKKIGLRPLAVHFDNGWNSELAVDNIKKTLDVLGIELYTYVVNWEEFRDLQLSYLRASIANCEVPTDHGITALLFRMAAKTGVKFILSGSNLATESIMPLSFGHFNQDLKNMKAIHRRFGTLKLDTMPTIGLPGFLYYVFVRGIRQIPFLNYIDYRKEEAKRMLARELGWRDYGGKHYESVWTRFFQGYYLPTKFGFDKRKAHYSSMICSGQMTREQALKEMENPPYDPELLREDMQFVLKKFGLTPAEFAEILNAPPRQAQEYPNHLFLFHTLEPLKNAFRLIATKP